MHALPTLDSHIAAMAPPAAKRDKPEVIAVQEAPIHIGTMPPMAPVPIHTVGQRMPYLISLMGVRHWVQTADWAVNVPMSNSNEYVAIKIPKGFVHDGASIPPVVTALAAFLIVWYFQHPAAEIFWLAILMRIMAVMLNPIGLSLIAGIVHDYLYQYHKLEGVDGKEYYRGCSLWAADRLFFRMHWKVNGMVGLAQATYLGLIMGSFVAWSKHRKRIALEPT